MDGERWTSCKPGFFLPVRVLLRPFRRRFLGKLEQAHRRGLLQFIGEYAALSQWQAFADWLPPLRHGEWVVYTKRPFTGPQSVLAYLARYTHRVTISNSRLAIPRQSIPRLPHSMLARCLPAVCRHIALMRIWEGVLQSLTDHEGCSAATSVRTRIADKNVFHRMNAQWSAAPTMARRLQLH